MARKLTARELALVELGDFATEDAIRKRAAEIETAKLDEAARAFSATFETLKGQSEKPAAVSSDEAAREDSPKNGEIIEAPEPMPMPEPEPEKRKRGRPHKHKAAGGQFSVWLPDETKKRLQVRAAAEGISAGELAARFIEAGLLK
jgi:hypothetical protein